MMASEEHRDRNCKSDQKNREAVLPNSEGEAELRLLLEELAEIIDSEGGILTP